MADYSARREARRRKLLLSSEERLKKITQLNDKMKVNAAADNSNDAETGPVTAAVTTPPISCHQVQSEDAEEGEREVSSLPQEDLQGERSYRADAEGNAEAELVAQMSELQETDHSTEEQIKESRNDQKELERDFGVDEESSAATLDATMKTSRITDQSEDANPTTPQDFVESSPSQTDSGHSSFSSAVHSQHPSNKIPSSAPQSKPHSILAFRNIPASSMATAASSTTQPELPVADVTQEAAPTARTGHFLTTRELLVVFVAVLMRLMLAVDWLAIISGQSIMIPFVAAQVMFFYLNPQRQQPAGGMMVKVLSFAAMMSNIPQASVKKLQLILSVVNKFCEDLALYLFAFILTHGVVELLT